MPLLSRVYCTAQASARYSFWRLMAALIKPDDVLEQETMFIKDPSGNIMELKTMVNPDALFGEE